MNSWQSGDVETNGIQAHYTRTGGDKPSLVLLHGFSDDGLCWMPVAEALSLDFDVIMPDARAHGRSSAPESGYDLITQARDLHGIVQALGLKKPSILGHSMGAVTTLVFAGLYPDLPAAILLEDPPPWWNNKSNKEETAETRQDDGFRAWVKQFKSKSREALMAQARVENPSWAEVEVGPWADSKMLFNPVILNEFPDIINSKNIDWETILPGVTCPVLLITADPSLGSILTPAGIKTLEKMIPHLHSVHIAQAGHSIRRDQFAPYMKTIKSFLAEVK